MFGVYPKIYLSKFEGIFGISRGALEIYGVY